MRTTGYIIGIDPDVTASGVAIIDCEARRVVDCLTVPMWRVMNVLYDWRLNDVIVVLEESALSTRNWHVSPRDSVHVAAAKGRSVGMCHATARHIAEWAEYLNIKVVPQPPLIKCWKGRDRKITHDELAQFATGLPAHTNQEVRDAVLLAWNYAGYPIRLRPDNRR